MRILTQEVKNRIQTYTFFGQPVNARIMLCRELGFNKFAEAFGRNKGNQDKIQELSYKLFEVVFYRDPSLKELF